MGKEKVDVKKILDTIVGLASGMSSNIGGLLQRASQSDGGSTVERIRSEVTIGDRLAAARPILGSFWILGRDIFKGTAILANQDLRGILVDIITKGEIVDTLNVNKDILATLVAELIINSESKEMIEAKKEIIRNASKQVMSSFTELIQKLHSDINDIDTDITLEALIQRIGIALGSKEKEDYSKLLETVITGSLTLLKQQPSLLHTAKQYGEMGNEAELTSASKRIQAELAGFAGQTAQKNMNIFLKTIRDEKDRTKRLLIDSTQEHRLHTLDFSKLTISSITLADRIIENANFSGGTLQNMNFAGSIFKGVNFKDVKLGAGISFDGCTFESDTFKSLYPSLKQALIDGVKVDLTGLKLVGDFSGVDFSGLDLTGCDFSQVTSLKKAIFDFTILTDANIPARKFDNKLFQLAINTQKSESTAELKSRSDVLIEEFFKKCTKDLGGLSAEHQGFLRGAITNVINTHIEGKENKQTYAELEALFNDSKFQAKFTKDLLASTTIFTLAGQGGDINLKSMLEFLKETQSKHNGLLASYKAITSGYHTKAPDFTNNLLQIWLDKGLLETQETRGPKLDKLLFLARAGDKEITSHILLKRSFDRYFKIYLDEVIAASGIEFTADERGHIAEALAQVMPELSKDVYSNFYFTKDAETLKYVININLAQLYEDRARNGISAPSGLSSVFSYFGITSSTQQPSIIEVDALKNALKTTINRYCGAIEVRERASTALPATITTITEADIGELPYGVTASKANLRAIVSTSFRDGIETIQRSFRSIPALRFHHHENPLAESKADALEIRGHFIKSWRQLQEVEREAVAKPVAIKVKGAASYRASQGFADFIIDIAGNAGASSITHDAVARKHHRFGEKLHWLICTKLGVSLPDNIQNLIKSIDFSSFFQAVIFCFSRPAQAISFVNELPSFLNAIDDKKSSPAESLTVLVDFVDKIVTIENLSTRLTKDDGVFRAANGLAWLIGLEVGAANSLVQTLSTLAPKLLGNQMQLEKLISGTDKEQLNKFIGFLTEDTGTGSILAPLSKAIPGIAKMVTASSASKAPASPSVLVKTLPQESKRKVSATPAHPLAIDTEEPPHASRPPSKKAPVTPIPVVQAMKP